MKSYKIKTELEPRLISISFTIREDGVGEYMITTQANAGTRIKNESWGLATPSCGHLKCRWANLGRAALDWAELAVPMQGGGETHPEQLGLLYPLP